jgi:glycogen synthase
VVRAAESHANPALWRRMVSSAMARELSWTGPAAQYLTLYQEVRSARSARLGHAMA